MRHLWLLLGILFTLLALYFSLKPTARPAETTPYAEPAPIEAPQINPPSEPEGIQNTDLSDKPPGNIRMDRKEDHHKHRRHKKGFILFRPFKKFKDLFD